MRIVRIFGLVLVAGFALMFNRPIVYLISLLSGLVIGATIVHELSHYVIARIWTKHLSIGWNLRINPGKVNYHRPEEIPVKGFKLVAGVPLVAGIFFLLLSFNLLIFVSLVDFVVISFVYGLAGGLIGSVSPSDGFGMEYPDAFRRYCMDYDEFDLETAKEYKQD